MSELNLDSLSEEHKMKLVNKHFLKAVVQISKLLSLRLLGEGNEHSVDAEGFDPKEFDKAATNVKVDQRKRVRYALEQQGIRLASWIVPEINPSESECKLLCDSENPGFGLIFQLPYKRFEVPGDIPTDDIEEWITRCDDWLKQVDEGMDPELPKVTHPFIPLATT